MARWHGKTGVVKVGAVTVGSVRGWTLQADSDRPDVTSFGDTTKAFVSGLPNVRGQIDVNWDDTDTNLSSQINNTTPVTLVLQPVASLTAKNATGPAFIQLDTLRTAADQAVQGTYGFVASGSWTIAL